MSEYDVLLSGNRDPGIGMLVFRIHSSVGLNDPLLPCNGALISRTTYAALFAVIGTTFGVGDGSTTFKLPDIRGNFLRGLGGVDPDAASRTNRGDGTTGASVGTKQAAQTAAHYHTMPGGAQYESGGGAWSVSAGAATSAMNSPTGEMYPVNSSVKAYIKFK